MLCDGPYHPCFSVRYNATTYPFKNRKRGKKTQESYFIKIDTTKAQTQEELNCFSWSSIGNSDICVTGGQRINYVFKIIFVINLSPLLNLRGVVGRLNILPKKHQQKQSKQIQKVLLLSAYFGELIALML